MQEQVTPLCACGCGRALSVRAGVGTRFVRGHGARILPRGSRRTTPLEERFWPKVLCDLETRCWLWTGALMSKGYGSINMGKRGVTALASRVSWLIHYGVMPEEWVLHHCDTPRCVRPDHLFLGDVQANTDDMNDKGRGVLPKRQPTHGERARGERQGSARLTAQQVAEMRQAYTDGVMSQQRLADFYGISQAQISRILRRESWTHVA